MDRPREECGIFAVFGHPRAVELTYHGLFALQHRGQESAGIAAHRPGEGELAIHRGPGLVGDVFSRDRLAGLADHPPRDGAWAGGAEGPHGGGWSGGAEDAGRGAAGDTGGGGYFYGGGRPRALGHVRCAAPDEDVPENYQPLMGRCRGGQVAAALNGSFANAGALRRGLEEEGAVFHTSADLEVLIHLAARRGGDWPEAIGGALQAVAGGYALAFLTPDGIFGCRDPHGIRPLVLGELDGASVLASETCALDAVGAEPVRELEPGEWVWLHPGGIRSGRLPGPPATPAFCIFEFVYFARPDSILRGRSVHAVRKEMGRLLALEKPVDADVIVGAPHSGILAAAGYAEGSGLPWELGLIKNRYVGRTFIGGAARRSPGGADIRADRTRLNPIAAVVRGKRVILVDDSIIKGGTSRELIKAIREAGAVEVHLRVASPPYRHPCHYASDGAQPLAARYGVEEMRRFIGADSLHFLSWQSALQATRLPPETFCKGCFSQEGALQ